MVAFLFLCVVIVPDLPFGFSFGFSFVFCVFQASNNGHVTDQHIFHITRWSSSVEAPPEMASEKTFAERCALGEIERFSNGFSNGTEAEESDYFQCLFNLLSLDDASKASNQVRQSAWELITLLPVHPRRQSALLHCSSSMRATDWSALIQPDAAPLQR